MPAEFRVVEMVPEEVVEIVPVEVVEMVPALVVEMVPALVVEMVPPFGNAAVASANTSTVERDINLRDFIVFS